MGLRRPALRLRRSPSARASLSSDKEEVPALPLRDTRAAPARIPAGCVNMTSWPLLMNLSVEPAGEACECDSERQRLASCRPRKRYSCFKSRWRSRAPSAPARAAEVPARTHVFLHGGRHVVAEPLNENPCPHLNRNRALRQSIRRRREQQSRSPQRQSAVGRSATSAVTHAPRFIRNGEFPPQLPGSSARQDCAPRARRSCREIVTR